MDSSTSAFGLTLPDGKFLPFGAAGNEQASTELAGVTEKSNPRVTVDGETDGTMIAVGDLSFR